MDELVKKLSEGKHRILADHAKSAEELQASVDRGFVLLKFPDTRGGTTLGTRLDKTRCEFNGTPESGGTAHLVGSLVLNYNEVELTADLDLATLEGTGFLTLIADEPEWRAKQMRQEAQP